MANLLRVASAALAHLRTRVESFFASPKRRMIALTSGLLVAGIFVYALWPHLVVHAQTAGTAASTAGPTWVDTLIKGIALIGLTIAGWIGTLIATLINIIVAVILYNHFSTSEVVSAGWAIVRDAVNMFYVILLIAIAFGTIIGYHKFNWSQQVPKLLMWAIVINFSKTLCGLAIDASQVFTLTFANALKDIAGGNFISFLGLTQIMSFSSAPPADIKAADLIGASLGAVLMMTIVLGVLVALLAILVFRIVMLWILIVVSPLTWFVGSAKGIINSNAYSQWWENFTCFLVIGPVLTFFLWLALAVAGSGNVAASEGFNVAEGSVGAMNAIFDMPRLTSFIIGLAILWAGFDVANQFCHNAKGGFVQKALGKAQSFTKATALAPVNLGKSAISGVTSRIPLVGAKGWKSDKLARGAQGVAARIPVVGGVVAGALGKRAEAIEHTRHEKAEAEVKEMEALGKAFASDEGKNKRVNEIVAGGKKPTGGEYKRMLGVAKKLVEDKEERKKMEKAGVDVNGLLQMFEDDMGEHGTLGHADPKFASAYKDFKKQNGDRYVKATAGVDGKKTFDFTSAIKDKDALKGFLSEDSLKRMKEDPEKLSQFRSFLSSFETGDKDDADNPLKALQMIEQGKLGKDAKEVFFSEKRAPISDVVAGFKNGEFASEDDQKRFESALRVDPSVLSQVVSSPEVMASINGNDGVSRATVRALASGGGKKGGGGGGGSDLLFANMRREGKKPAAVAAALQYSKIFSKVQAGADAKTDETARKFFTKLKQAAADGVYEHPADMEPIDTLLAKFARPAKGGRRGSPAPTPEAAPVVVEAAPVVPAAAPAAGEERVATPEEVARVESERTDVELERLAREETTRVEEVARAREMYSAARTGAERRTAGQLLAEAERRLRETRGRI